MFRYLPVVAACLLGSFSLGAHAQAVYKCSVDGKTSYSDRPCAHGASHVLPPVLSPSSAGISAADTLGPQGGDARTLLALEKARIAREKNSAREEREQARLARAAQAKRQKCDKLRLRRKWAEEDLARTVHGPAHEAARTKARRQAETLAVECPA
jgi:hypothetical protein